MTDIVERLRRMANALGGEDEDFLMQAVAEIERLRTVLQTIADAELTYDYDSGATLSNLARAALSHNTNGET